ncbi:MAG: DNA polymerase III subunit beta [Desulfuromonas sp.]|nr:MAG: DNA polymerase III subunit beta [Desulfuromonas sp.]
MEFSIEKEVFLKSLNQIQGIVEKKHTIPILSNVLIEAKDNNIFITATDLEIAVKSFYKSNIKKTGKVTISAKKLYEIIKELPNKEIFFKVKDNYWIEIKCGKSVFNLVGLSPDEFPKFPEFNNINFKSIDKKLLSEMIDKTIYSVSSDETKFNLTGIYFNFENELLTMVSTDGHRLSLISNKFDNFENTNFILPKKGIFEIRKLIEEKNEYFNIGISENNFIVDTGNTNLVMRLVDGEFPDYNRVIPEKNDNKAIINKNELLYSLKRVSTISSDKTKGIKINLKHNLLKIYSSNPDLGDANESIDVDYSGSEIDMGFNSKYLIDFLQTVEEENICLYLKDNLSPGILEQEINNNYYCVIMPMRL